MSWINPPLSGDITLYNRCLKKIIGISLKVLCILALIGLCFSFRYVLFAQNQKLSSELEKAISSSKSKVEKFHILIVMSAKYTFAPYTVSVKEQYDYIYKKRLEELKAFSASDQKNIMEFLNREKLAGRVSDIKTNLVKNLVALYASRDVIVEKLSRRDDVAFILPYDETTFSDQKVSAAQLNIVDYTRDYQSALARLNDANPLARRAAINYIAQMKNPDSIKPLVATLSDNDPLVRRSAVEALANFRGVRTVENAVLELIQKENDISVKISAIRTAGELGSAIFAETLNALAADQFAIYRAESVKALAKIRPITDVTRRIMIKSASDEAEGVRIAAMDASSRNSFTEAIPSIISNLSDPIALVRRAACEALGRLSNKAEHITLLEKIALNDTDNSVRVEAANSAELIKSRLKSQSR